MDAEILLIDAHSERREILARWLARQATHVRACHPDACPECVGNGASPDVLVIDAQALQRISASRLPQSASALLLTATNDTANSHRITPTVQLFKPPKPSELRGALRLCVRRGEAAPASHAAPRAVADHGTRQLKILLAEDSHVNQAVIRGMLEGVRHELTVADNGQQAVDCLDQETFDIVLMDVQMPVLDGLQATREIRRREQGRGRRTPIIALTAHALESDRQLCLDSGMDEHLAKPVRRNRLLETIDAYTGNQLALEPAAPPTSAPPTAMVEGDPPLDWAVAMESVQGNADLMRELIEIYLQEAPKLMDELQRAVEQRDAPKIRIVSHTLKGSTRYFGDIETARLAYELEQRGKSADLAEAPNLLQDLRTVLDALIQELRAYLRRVNS